MNKFCKASLCVENVRESYVLISRRVVDVPGSEDAIRLAFLILIFVKLSVCSDLFADRPVGLGIRIGWPANAVLLKTGFGDIGTC